MNANLRFERLARQLRTEHHTGPVLVIANAWDVASAVLFTRAGARAIGTTSNAIAASLGYPDGQRIPRDVMVEAIGRIAAAVPVPVTADIEAGYGPTVEDVAATVGAIVAAGAVGINLEDAPGIGGKPLFAVAEQADRLRAARAAGGADLVINARTDVYLRQVGDPADRLADVVRRAEAYAQAGADCLFVPGLLDLDILAEVVARSPLPVNAMAKPGGPSVAQLAAIGVRRVSVGPLLARTAWAAATTALTALLADGNTDVLAPAAGLADLGEWITTASTAQLDD